MEPFPALRFHMTEAGPFPAARCPPAPLSVPVSGPCLWPRFLRTRAGLLG